MSRHQIAILTDSPFSEVEERERDEVVKRMLATPLRPQEEGEEA
jgi:hypothetical protein